MKEGIEGDRKDSSMLGTHFRPLERFPGFTSIYDQRPMRNVLYCIISLKSSFLMVAVLEILIHSQHAVPFFLRFLNLGVADICGFCFAENRVFFQVKNRGSKPLRSLDLTASSFPNS